MLKRNALWNISGNAIYAAAQWGVMVVLAKLASTSEIGQFSLGLAVTAPLFMLTNLQLRAIQITDISDEIKFGEYLGLRLITVAVSMLFLAIYSLHKNSEIAWIIFAVGLSKAFEAVSDVTHGLFQRHERSKLVAKSLIIKSIFSTSILSVSYYLFQNLLYSALSMAASWLGVLIFFDLQNASKLSQIKPRIELKVIRKVLFRAVPLGISMMFISLQVNVIRFYLEHYVSDSALGVFSALSYLLMIGSIFMNSINQAASPRLASFWIHKNFHSFKKLLFLLICFAFIGGVISIAGAVFFGKEILILIYSQEFASSKDILVILAVGGLFSYLASVLGYAITAARIVKPQPYLFFIVFLIGMSCAWSFIPRWGVWGAAWATTVVAIVQLLGSFFLLFHATRNNR